MLKKVLLGFGILLLFGLVYIALFSYKAKHGINFFEHEPIVLDDSLRDFNVLVFSKTNGFRHGSSIEESRRVYSQIARKNGWGIIFTESGGVFNPDQINRFQVVIWNNVTGRCLTEQQREVFKNYIVGGGSYIGVHGSGDFSHSWAWYEDELIGARFSHHSMNPQLQTTKVFLECEENAWCGNLPKTASHTDEWYVFYDSPRKRGFKVAYNIKPGSVITNGNIPLVVKSKDFGMTDDHPVAWYKEVSGGRTFYTSLGHTKEAVSSQMFTEMLEAAIKWAGRAE